MKLSKRHLFKTISWRFIGSVDTILISWFISSDLNVGLKIGLLELLTKMIFYYLHERIWFKSSVSNANKRHVLKTFTWRIIGTLDTMFLGWIITGDFFTGIKIGMVEIITKMVLYFFHEKLWYKFNFGLEKIR